MSYKVIHRFGDESLEQATCYETEIHKDSRGHFIENWKTLSILPDNCVQDNIVRTKEYCLRGLHYQLKKPQGKLVSVVHNFVYDVIVDIRTSSKTFGASKAYQLMAGKILWVPPGFAHGYATFSEEAVVMYKVSGDYQPDDQHVLLYNDPTLRIIWPNEWWTMSEKDKAGLTLKELADKNLLPGV